jgi:hypothetical protein
MIIWEVYVLREKGEGCWNNPHGQQAAPILLMMFEPERRRLTSEEEQRQSGPGEF